MWVIYSSEELMHSNCVIFCTQEIPLADMLAVDPLDEQVNSAAVALTPPHVFEIVTSSVTYYVGVDMTGFSPADLKPSSNNDDDGEYTLRD